MALNSIFISHESRDSGIAEALETLFKAVFRDVTVLRSTSTNPSVGPSAGSEWRDWIATAVRADAAIFVLSRRPSDWMIWEMGAVAIANKGGTGIPVLFGLPVDDVPEQLEHAHAVDGTIIAGVNLLINTFFERHRVFGELNSIQKHALFGPQVEECYAQIKKILETRRQWVDFSRHFSEASSDVVHASGKNGSVFKEALNIFANDVSGTARKVRGARNLEIPAVRYPKYLLQLQGNKKRVVKALALVGELEHFWRDRVGLRIAAEAHADSQRIFVFRNPDSLKNHIDLLKRHAKEYRVRVLQHDALVADLPGYAHDFSIIHDPPNIHGAVVATYAVRDTLAGDGYDIVFNAANDVINEYSKVFAEAWKFAKDIDSSDEALAEEVFGPVVRRLRPLQKRTIEMSRYVDIGDYDQHEEEHAYYVDMMARMTEIIRNNMPQGGARVLELGAGTGIFTRRLAAVPEIAELEAVELDWACYQRLKNRVRGDARIKVHFEDSRTYNAEGTFDFVVSSFSDHHISEEDKQAYFLNVRNNLRTNGLFIVGDEFLREAQMPDEEQERRAALHAYHEHIIGIAQANGHEVLASLERCALDSGLERKGDFKLSRSRYRMAVINARFEIKEEIVIGPVDNPVDIGGVCLIVVGHRPSLAP